MTKRTAFERVHNTQSFQENKNLWEYAEISRQIEFEIQNFVKNEAIKCEIAKQQGWLGSLIERDHRGFLGYLRTGLGIQLKILNRFENIMPILQNEFVGFFRSDFFKKTVLENNCVKPIFKKEHLEIIKKFNL